MNHAFYKSKKWERLRRAVLARDGYKCQVSKRYGKNVPANTVHHVFPVEDYPQYRLCAWNLIAVSAETHNRLHDRNTNQLTDEGLDILMRIARKKGIEYHGREERNKEDNHSQEVRTEDHSQEVRGQGSGKEDSNQEDHGQEG